MPVPIPLELDTRWEPIPRRKLAPRQEATPRWEPIPRQEATPRWKPTPLREPTNSMGVELATQHSGWARRTRRRGVPVSAADGQASGQPAAPEPPPAPP